MTGKTLFEKIWERHVVTEQHGQTLLYIDRHLCHDGSFAAFKRLRQREVVLRRPNQTFMTPDHYTPTHTASLDDLEDPRAREIATAVETNAREFGATAFPWGDRRQGIVHVVGPEQGITLPGLTMVCGDSHTSTHGGLGSGLISSCSCLDHFSRLSPKSGRLLVSHASGSGSPRAAPGARCPFAPR